jgi:hypothetical protein
LGWHDGRLRAAPYSVHRPESYDSISLIVQSAALSVLIVKQIR